MQTALARDPGAFRELMRKHNQTLYRTARAILRDDTEAEEAVQDAWIAAYRAMDTFRGDAKVSTWLVRIVVNESLQRPRRARRTAAVIPMSIADADESTRAETTPYTNPPTAPAGPALRGAR